MPSGDLHQAIYMDKGKIMPVLLLLEVGIMPFFPNHFLEMTYLVFGTAVGYFPLGLLIDPDADLVSLTKSEGRVMRLVGKKPRPPKYFVDTRYKLLRPIVRGYRWITYILQHLRFFFGKFIVWAWLSILLGYALLVVPKHRHWISHSYVISTFIRLVYMWFMVGIIISGILSQVYLDMWMQALFSPFGLGVFIGLSVADALHIMADYGRIELTKYEEIVKGKKRGR